MLKLFLTITLVSVTQILSAQADYWQQEVHYTISVALDDQQHSLKGDLQLVYINNSPDTLRYIWFHIWPNAYRNEQTAMAKQLMSDRDGRKTRKNQEAGWIDSLYFTVDNKKVLIEQDVDNSDMVKLVLTEPLFPGRKLNIQTPFFVKLPGYYSRMGHDGQQYMICQWYPKPAVYDREGWHPMPYLDQGEFYSEFGSFIVNITIPSEYVVGATGILQTKEELREYKRIGSINYRNKEAPLPVTYHPHQNSKLKTLTYKAENVHDFAWFADKDFIIQYDTLQFDSGNIIDVFSYAQPNGNSQWKSSISFIEDATRNYSSWLGEYPYPVVQAVEGPQNQSSGGMEYPMITLITSPGAGKEELDAVIAHEVGHNWLYGILASNEREHPWMDEGLNTYYQFRYEAIKYRGNSVFGDGIPVDIRQLPLQDFLEKIYGALNKLPAKKPIFTSSTAFSNKDEYGTVVYLKTAVWFFIIESAIGREKLDKGMREYYEKWKFRHPYPENLRQILEQSSGTNLEDLFQLLNKKGSFQ
jgi:hypothetical protein